MPVQLKPHQEANIRHLFEALSRFGGVLDGSDTGTGKTFTALGLCKALGARPAVITRKAIIPSWESACRDVGVIPLFVTNYEAAKSANFSFGGIVETPRGAKHYEWSITEPRVIVIFDEAQALRGRTSMNSKMAVAAHKKYKTLLLSATPFQTPLEACTIGVIIGLFKESEYYRWLFNNGCKKNFMGHMEFVGDKKDRRDETPGANAEKGRKVMAKIHESIFPLRGVRTRREDIPGFPESLVLFEAVETGHADEITRIYQAIIEEQRKADHAKAVEFVDPEFADMVEPLAITRILRHRQEAEVLKAKAIAEMAQVHAERGESVAIFVNFDATIELLAEYLDCRYIVRGDNTGRSMSTIDRFNTVRAFQMNTTPYVIVNIKAGGAGLSLHDPETKRTRVALISPPYSAVDFKQVLGRTHRLGGGHSTQKLLFAAGTVEEDVMRRVKNRASNLDTLLDSDVVI